MTETTRAPKRKMTFDPKTLIAHIDGIGEIDGDQIPEAIRTELFGVGLLTTLGRVANPGIVYREMRAGAWSRRAEPAPKAMTAWQAAISQVKADDLIRARKAGGDKITAELRADCAKQADTWTRGLTKEQIDKAKNSAAVRAAHGELIGVKGSLDDLLAPAAPPAVEEPAGDTELLDAAD